MKYIYALFLLFFFSLNAHSQNELKNWYFGMGTDGITFVNNVPQKLTDKLSGVGYEGMIVVNDPLTGDLLFYSDGIQAVNKNHVIMTNGAGLSGHFSGAQCVQCCPVPGTCAKQFYLFTNSAWDNTQGKISYSVVDFTTDPLGAVTNKNTLFWNGPSDQGMCLVNKPNSNDYWLIANSFTTATYNVWPITSTGVGIPQTYTFSNTGSSYVIYYDKGTGKLTVGGGGNKKVTMIDFDANTGVLSNEVQLAPGFYSAGSSRFSPDGTKLYAGMQPTSGTLPRLYQYDFNTAAWTDMNTCCYAHDLKFGPDGKLYFIHTYNSAQPIGVVDFPDRSAVSNACNYHTLTFTPAFNGQVRRFPETVILPTPVTANADSVNLTSNSINIPILANDSASLNGVFSIDAVITQPLHGTATISGNDIIYTATQDVCGVTDTFIYRIKNQDCATDTAMVRVNFPACPPPMEDTTNGLAGYYTFCDCTAHDNSINHRDGTVVGTPRCIRGIRDNGFEFNETPGGNNGCGLAGGQYIKLPPLGAIWADGFTVCAWVRYDEIQSYERIIDFSNNTGEAGGMPIWFGREGNSNNLTFESWISADGGFNRSTGRLTAVNAITNGNIEYYCATISGDTMRIYVNGNLVAEKQHGNPIANVARTNNYIGHSAWYCNDPDFKGFMDEVRIYNRALSPEEIQSLFTIKNVTDFTAAPACNSTSASFLMAQVPGVDSVHWNFGDAVSGAANTATGFTAQHQFSTDGDFTVTAIAYKFCINDTVVKQVHILPKLILTNDTTVCEGAQFTLRAQPAGLGYSWSPSAGLSSTSVQNPTITASRTTTYYLTSKRPSGNLVVNGDFEQGNTGFSTGYLYSGPNPLAPPGHYTVAPSITNPWYANCADHTPTGANNMLLVDGANGSSGVAVGTMLWCQTVTVTPNTDYAFSTWLTNLNASGATSQLRFSINGVQVGAVQNTPLGTCQWNQFYVLWNSGAATTANICISEASGAQPGNDLAIDDIFFGTTVLCTDSVKVTVIPAEYQHLKDTICAGQQYSLHSGIAVHSTGVYYDTLHSITGCDSIIIDLDLTVLPQTIAFTAPDTVCLNSPVNIVNTSTCASSYFWSFCSADINSIPPDAVNLGNPGNLLNGPAFSDYVKDNTGNYYLFVTNFSSGNLVRLDFGNNLLNIPTAVNLGNFGGILIPGGTEGIQVVHNENKWYAIITVGKINNPATAGLVKLDFGSAITNTSPTATSWGNIGNLNYPCDITMFQQFGNWYGLVLNKSGNTISRFNFSNSFDNIPAGVNLGNPGDLNNPTGIYAIYDNGNWYAFITNSYQDDPSHPNYGTITRIDFGTSLLNTPSGTNLGNIGGLLNNVRDIYIVKTCGNDVGFVVNWNSNDIVKLDFHNDITSTPTGTSLGNIGQMQIPHSISKFFRVGNDLYSFTTNLGNSITRFRFAGCTSTNIPNSNAYNPPQVIYSFPGTYTINLITDDSLPTQSSFCKQIVVLDDHFVKAGRDTVLCKGSSLQLNATGAVSYSWAPVNDLSDPNIANPVTAPVSDTRYVVTGTSSIGCTAKDTVDIAVKPLPVVKTNNDTTFCKGSTVQLNTIGAAAYSWTPATGLSDPSVPDPVAAPLTASAQYIVTGASADQCIARDTVNLTMLPLPVITKTNDTSICKNTAVRLFAGGGVRYQWSSTSGTINNPTAANPVVTPGNNSTYYVTVTDANKCVSTDSVKISFRQDPVFTVSPGQQVCSGKPAQLQAAGGDSYSWSPASLVSSAAAQDPLTNTNETTTYSVLITESTCNVDTILFTTVTVLPPLHITVAKSNDVDCTNGTAKLSASGALSYSWHPATGLSDTAVANPVASPLTTQKYVVKGSDAEGCTGYDTITVYTNYTGNTTGYAMPNAFTPNNDGINDCFGIKYWGLIKKLQFSVYDRWGNTIFYTVNPADCWNGTYKGQPANTGAYLYYINAVTTCGTVERKGTVILTR